jgi:hypothetical protein
MFFLFRIVIAGTWSNARICLRWNNAEIFIPDELASIEKIFNGIMDHTVKNRDQLSVVINAFAT